MKATKDNKILLLISFLDNSMNNSENSEASKVVEPKSNSLMAINYREKKIGCAISKEEMILVMEELPETKPFHLIDLLVTQFMPTSILMPSRIDEELFLKFDSEIRQLRPMHEFTVSSAMIKMRHNGIMVGEDLSKRCPLSFGCIGALINTLAKDCDQLLQIDSIEWFSMYQKN